MSDLRQQLRDHYAARSLSRERVAAILAQGRTACEEAATTRTAAHPRPAWRGRSLLALAAAIALLAGGLFFFLLARARPDYSKLRPAIAAFFVTEPNFPKMSEQPAELRQWVIDRGAPSGFRIPVSLLRLDSKACAILEVGERPAYLLCFLKEDKSGRRNGGMVHLIVARRHDFRNLPPTEKPSIHTAGKWSFASWTEGEILYTVATPAPVAELQGYLASFSGSMPMVSEPRREIATAVLRASTTLHSSHVSATE